MTSEIDCYSYKELPVKNSGFKNLEKSGRVATLIKHGGALIKIWGCMSFNRVNEIAFFEKMC